MLRINTIASSAQAKNYYGQGLARQDGFYYSQEPAHEIAGHFGGKAAQQMGLEGEVTQQACFDLAEHKNPVTGEALTKRRNENRRVGHDMTFSAPKSVSVYHAHTQVTMHILKMSELLKHFRPL